MQRHYQLSIGAVLTGELSWRKLKALVSQLPPGSATVRSQSGDSWTVTDHLLAGVIDLLSVANWQRGGDKRAKRPKPCPRPGLPARRPGRHFGTASMPIDEMRRLMQRHNRGGGHGD